jgi:hypothetical protein
MCEIQNRPRGLKRGPYRPEGTGPNGPLAARKGAIRSVTWAPHLGVRRPILARRSFVDGRQGVRDRLALQAMLDMFLRKELAAWAKRVPDEFYEHILGCAIGRGRNEKAAETRIAI